MHNARQYLVSHLIPLAWGCCAALSLVTAAYAGRPLATDDAAVADPGSCQVEGWVEHSKESRSVVVSPACGVIAGVEIGGEYVKLHPADPVRAEAGLAVKWVPDGWRMSTSLGDVQWGAKLSSGHVRPSDGGWQVTETAAAVLATLEASEQWSFHGNLGMARDRDAEASIGFVNVAAQWTPSSKWLLFAESSFNDQSDLWGKPTHTVGARYWVLEDKLGMDLTSSHQSGSSTVWSLGVGWYGLFK